MTLNYKLILFTSDVMPAPSTDPSGSPVELMWMGLDVQVGYISGLVGKEHLTKLLIKASAL